MNDSTIAGKFDKAVGKVKEAAGEAFGDQKLANAGAADQVKGSAKEGWGEVKDAAHDAGTSTHDRTYTETDRVENKTAAAGHDARQSVTSTAENIKNSLHNKLEDLKGDRR